MKREKRKRIEKLFNIIESFFFYENGQINYFKIVKFC